MASARARVATSTALRTSFGLLIASSSAIMAPSEVPTIRHGPRSSASISPRVSATMSSSV
jgi:hypothetical protein